MKFDRRGLLAGGSAFAASACVPLDRTAAGRLAGRLRLIEAGLGGELGVAFLDPASGKTLGYRQDQRFAMCSTFKASLTALLLSRDEVDAGERVRWSESDLLSYAPFTRERLATGATWRELAQAAVELSDNTAANLLLARLGGPEALTAFWRSLGDATSRLDRIEGELNFVPAGEVRDTTTPAAMAATMAKLVGDDVLDAASRATLRGWLAGCKTGLTKVRAGLPDDWAAGDKTGNSGEWPGMGYSRGDIGFAVGPANEAEPVCFAVYHRAPLSDPPAAEAVDKAFADVGRTLTAWIRDNYRIILT